MKNLKRERTISINQKRDCPKSSKEKWGLNSKQTKHIFNKWWIPEKTGFYQKLNEHKDRKQFSQTKIWIGVVDQIGISQKDQNGIGQVDYKLNQGVAHQIKPRSTRHQIPCLRKNG